MLNVPHHSSSPDKAKKGRLTTPMEKKEDDKTDAKEGGGNTDGNEEGDKTDGNEA